LAVAPLTFGCADGIFLPSLAKYFSNVVAVDSDPLMFASSQHLVSRSSLQNVRVVFNRYLPVEDNHFWSIERLGEEIGGGFSAIFVLETLEHVGESFDTMYSDKISLVRGLMALLAPGGILIASVPRMTGPLFGIKYLVQLATGRKWEPMSVGEAMASVAGNTDSLRHRWTNNHVGFNEHKLKSELQLHFKVDVHRSLTSFFYAISGTA
jgi:2-polyprenyl-3-methyl-5-hydroxy-6-metoxy-1,4-benzoquinol methylase